MFIRVLRGKISQLLRRCTAGGDATLFLKQQLPAITLQFFQGNIFMTIAVTLPTIAVDPTRPERQQHIARERTDRADGLFSVFRVLRGLIFVSREWSRV